jgi:outer membrane protein assembly factor BamB
MEGVNLQRTGVYPTKAVHQLSSILWKSSKLFEINYATAITSEFDSSIVAADVGFSDPILANGLIYIRLTTSLTQNYIAAVDSNTGEGVWTFKLKQFLSAPTIAGDSVYVVADDGNFYILDALTGTEKWRYSSKGLKWNTYASPVVVNGMVYCVGMGGVLYEIDITKKDARVIFKSKENLTPFAINHDTIYVSGKGSVYSIDMKTGAQKWTFTVKGMPARPIVAQEMLFFRTEEGNLYGLDIKTGQQKWMIPIGGKIRPVFPVTSITVGTNLSFSNGMIFFAGAEKNSNLLFAIEAASGIQKWTLKVDAPCRSPIIADGVLYIGSLGTLYAVDIKTGVPKWKLEFKSDLKGKTVKNVVSSPAIWDAVIYLVSDDGAFYAVK